ncbi:ABC transporter ATP-binding protein/permease [Candidatus Thioglobus sp.]|nr:ABC transporter ATP-binding protein/permease [Candidatus Thioglobus sp.]
MYRKILSLIKFSTSRSTSYLIFVTIIGIFLELIGIAAIIPVIDSITTTKGFLYNNFDFLNEMDQIDIVYVSMSLFVLLYFLKSIFLAYLAWVQTGFVYGVQEVISKKLFTNYISQKYDYHVKTSSSILIRNITNETLIFAEKVIYPAVLLISEFLVLIGVFAFLLWFDSFAAIVTACVLLGAGYLYHMLTYERNAQWGIKRHNSDMLKIKWLQESLGSIKDIKLKNCEQYFINEFSVHNNISASVSRLQSAFQRFPRLWLEFIAIVLISILIVVTVNESDGMSNLPITIAVFSMAAFRALPSANRVLSALHSLKYAHPTVDTIYKDIFSFKPLKEVSRDSFKGINVNDCIELKKVSVKYGEKNVLNDINLKIPINKTIGIIGESGSGKSTLVNVLIGLIEPTSGGVYVDNIDIRTDIKSWQEKIGYVSQDIVLLDKTIKENVAFGVTPSEINNDDFIHAINMANLSDFFDGNPERVDSVVGELGVKISGGQRQRIAIARAFYDKPEILIFDEATSALDNESQGKVMSAMRNLCGKKTVVIVAHRMSAVKECDIVYEIKNGFIDKVFKGDQISSL